MEPTPQKQKIRLIDLLTACAVISAAVWMALILLGGLSTSAHVAAACFIIFAAASSLLHCRVQPDAPQSEEPPAPMPSFRRLAKADRYCAACGAPLRKGDRFCAKCGSEAE